MFYLLNFENHQFISCDNANVVESHIQNLFARGVSMDSLEIVNGNGEEVRFDVAHFRAYCEDLCLLDNPTVQNSNDFRENNKLSAGMVDTSNMDQDSKRSLWMRLGVSIDVTPEELKTLQAEHPSADESLVNLLCSGRCRVDGDTYFPQEVNNLREDLDFNLPSMAFTVQSPIPERGNSHGKAPLAQQIRSAVVKSAEQSVSAPFSPVER